MILFSWSLLELVYLNEFLICQQRPQKLRRHHRL